ncbi:hypothetical protein DVH24_008603 [Malus domestica]|uniref:Uncharacterized protein n=1 Tax=Malus domestica TaxID=3750 RepID=A0A498JQF4_MALDO|nr:hypothetical protein DVH24_008603 [Malus domestica]
MKRSGREEIAAVKKAKHLNDVKFGTSSAIDEQYREQLLSSEAPSADERREWWHAFYGGAAFSSSARFPLIVALNYESVLDDNENDDANEMRV